ncbi:MAG: hypothetical protein BWY83_03344 [bacterium ADurb.Bin478]|nr:MAG: hypothetical protein BWY83_03344 [bacterium ADurb.Bin478]
MRHLKEVARNGFRLAALLSADARIRARRVDQTDHRPFKPGSQFHQPQRFAIALRMRHAKVTTELFLGLARFLMADHHHRLLLQTADAGDDGRVITEETVAVQFNEIGDHRLDVIQRVRPVGVTGQLHPLPARQFRIDLGAQAHDLRFELFNLFCGNSVLRLALVAQFGDAGFKLPDGLFKVQHKLVHITSSKCAARFEK